MLFWFFLVFGFFRATLFSLENVYYDEELRCEPRQAFKVTDGNGKSTANSNQRLPLFFSTNPFVQYYPASSHVHCRSFWERWGASCSRKRVRVHSIMAV